MARGRFITVEGIDGAGKSTQLAALIEHLRARGLDPLVTREPGGTPLGETLRTLVLTQPMAVPTETLLVFAARAEHVEQVIEPALAAGRWVLCDRFTDATFAYQCGGRGLAWTAVEMLAAWVHPGLAPDLTLLFDIDPARAAERLAAARSADRFESEQVEFFARVRTAYLRLAAHAPERFVTLDSAAAPAAVRAAMLAAVDRWLG
jgi:dTMP kinase